MRDKFSQINEKTWKNSKFFYPTENTVFSNKYFFITKMEKLDRKTPVYHIFEFNTNHIGEIKWYTPWRKFCFYPDKDTVWDNKCLNEVVDFLDFINKKYIKNRNGDVDL